jgi:hypothetical protein
MLKDQTSGYYVDIGCRNPYRTNNTWILEDKLGFEGISLDIVDYSHEWTERKSTFIQMDAVHGDLRKVFKEHNVPKIVDYLTHDLEGNGDRYRGLVNIPFDEYEFKVITIEHDAYRGYAETEREPQRRLLEANGYTLVASNVRSYAGDLQEDWWVNEKHIPRKRYVKFLSESQKFTHIFKFAGYDIDKLYDSNLKGVA